MSRRSLTLLLSLLLAAGLVGAAAVAQVPYVGLVPGPTYNTLGSVGGTEVIRVSGRRTYPTQGELHLTTVKIPSPGLTLAQALRGWFDPDVAVVPRENIYPPGRSDAQVSQANNRAMTASQDAATTAALRQLGIPIRTQVVVGAVDKGTPASGALEPGDVVTHVDRTPVSDQKALRARVSARSIGDPVTLSYLRGGRTRTVTLRTAAAREGQPARPVIGVQPQDRAEYPFDVSFSLKDVGGPSAGLMFALGLVDKLDPQPLTGGKHIAGTGEISSDGTVGGVGGIPQKLLGARRTGATVFLTPAENCKEALRTKPDGLTLVRVATLQQALQGLRVLRDGGTPQTCADAA